MPAPQKNPPAHEQLFTLAVLARREGRSFEDFWRLAVRPGEPAVTWATPAHGRPARCIVWPRDTRDRQLSRAATNEAKEGWRRAYEGEPPSGPEKALALLAPLFEMAEHGGEPRDELPVPAEQLALIMSLDA